MADNFKPVQAQVFTLSGSGISSSDTSIILSSFKLPDGTTNITMTDFGTIGYGVLEQGTTREETVSFTGVTQNGNGTATLTGVTRGIRFVDPYDSVGANKFSHSGGTSFVLSNPAVFYSKFTNKENDETINGTWTFTTIPELPASNPTTDNQAARKAYVDTKLALAGGTMTGALTLSGAPTLDLHAATKKYVDDTAFAGAPDASTTQKGVVEIATQAEVNAGTQIGGTGAFLAVGPDTLESKINSLVIKVDADTDQTQTTQNGSRAVGEANATTRNNILAQSFIPTKTGIAGVRLWKAADTGSFTGTVTIALQADSSGNPSGSNLASFTITNAAWLKLNAAAEFGIRFSSEYNSLSTSSTYWIVISTSTADNSNRPNLGINTAGGYANGQAKYYNVTDGWVTITGQDLYFRTIQGLNSKVITTESSGGLQPSLTRGYQFLNIGNTTVNANYSSGSSGTTVLYSTQLEGGLITANSGLKIDLVGRLLISAVGGFSSSVQFGVRYNGTTLITDTLSHSEVTTSGGYHVERYTIIIRNQSSISSQSSRLFADAQPDTSLVTTVARFRQATSTSTVDFSQPGLLEIVGTAVGGGTSNVSATFYGCTVEKIS